MPTLLRRLSGTLAVTAAALVAGATLAGPAAAVELAPPGPAPALDPQVLTVLDQVNTARGVAGCGPLLMTDPLTAAARAHSDEMAATGTLTHYGIDGSTPRTRLAAVGVTPQVVAENVAYGFDGAGVVAAWLASPGHRTNLLDCRLVVVGIAETPSPMSPFWTQVLAGV